MKYGTQSLSKLRYYTNDIRKAYYGSNLVYSKSSFNPPIIVQNDWIDLALPSGNLWYNINLGWPKFHPYEDGLDYDILLRYTSGSNHLVGGYIYQIEDYIRYVPNAYGNEEWSFIPPPSGVTLPVGDPYVQKYPTPTQWKELFDYCTISNERISITTNEYNATCVFKKFTASNGNFIYFPLGDYMMNVVSDGDSDLVSTLVLELYYETDSYNHKISYYPTVAYNPLPTFEVRARYLKRPTN